MKLTQTILICCVILAFICSAGCSGSRRTTTTTTTTPGSAEVIAVEPDGTRIVEHEPGTTTVQVEEKKEHERHGLFGIIIDIITLPFRAVGALFSAIF